MKWIFEMSKQRLALQILGNWPRNTSNTGMTNIIKFLWGYFYSRCDLIQLGCKSRVRTSLREGRSSRIKHHVLLVVIWKSSGCHRIVRRCACHRKHYGQFLQSVVWMYALLPWERHNVYLNTDILTRNASLSYRTKSQKKRFEEELNERMIQAIDGINAQKWVLLFSISLLQSLVF